MSRLTLRLPDSLHQQLDSQAEAEGVSLNHFIVYSLTRAVAVDDLHDQAQRFDQLLKRYPPARAEKALTRLLAAREPAPQRAAKPRAPTPRSRQARRPSP